MRVEFRVRVCERSGWDLFFCFLVGLVGICIEIEGWGGFEGGGLGFSGFYFWLFCRFWVGCL